MRWTQFDSANIDKTITCYLPFFSLSEITQEALCSVKESQVVKWRRTKRRNPCKNNELRLPEKYGGGGGIRTRSPSTEQTNISDAESAQKPSKSKHSKTLPNTASFSSEQKPALSEHPQDKSAQPKCATCVQQNWPTLPNDLAQVVEAWDRLPKEIKAGILAMVNNWR